MLRALEDKKFFWVFAGVIVAIVMGDVALIWVLFGQPNSAQWLTGFRWPSLPG